MSVRLTSRLATGSGLLLLASPVYTPGESESALAGGDSEPDSTVPHSVWPRGTLRLTRSHARSRTRRFRPGPGAAIRVIIMMRMGPGRPAGCCH